MAFLTIAGMPIPTASDQAGQEYEEHRIDRVRMFDGAMRQIRGGIYRKWSVTTKYLDQVDYLAIVALLESNSVPLLATGDLLDGEEVGVIPRVISANPKQTTSGFKRRVVFEMWEAGGPLPADRTAVPRMAYLRGLGMKTGDWGGGTAAEVDALAPATNGDLVSAWEDQSANGVHVLGGANPNFLTWDSRFTPKLGDGNKIQFGAGTISGLEETYFSLIGSGYNAQANWTTLTSVDVSIGVIASDPAPLADGKNSLWLLGNTSNPGSGNTLYPKAADGHIWESCATNGIVDCGAAADLDSLNHYRVVVEPAGGSNNFRVYLNNVLLHQETRSAISFNSGFVIGAGGSGWFEGWIRDVVFFPSTRTTGQARSWDDYIRGVVDDAPLPE